MGNCYGFISQYNYCLHLVLKGRRKQVEIFGESVRHSYEEGPEDTRHIKSGLLICSATTTRKGLSVAHREMITFISWQLKVDVNLN